MTTKKQTVTEMRSEIRSITGRLPISRDPEFLASRLADLKKRERDSASAVEKYAEPWSNMSISMHVSARDATRRIAGGESVGVSELVRRAMREYAIKHGYAAEVSHFGEE